MSKVYLISEKTLKTESYINDNVDPAFILPAIITSQDIHLQPLIGTKLYKTLKEKVVNNEVEGIYKELLDSYIQPFLVNAVMSDIQLPLAYKIRNAGIVQTNNEYVNNNYLSDAEKLAAFYMNKMNFYGIRLSNFLHANSSKIPEYNEVNDCSDMAADSMAFNTGIYLG